MTTTTTQAFSISTAMDLLDAAIDAAMTFGMNPALEAKHAALHARHVYVAYISEALVEGANVLRQERDHANA